MKIEVVHDIPASPQQILVWMSDLETFPQWTNLLHHVESQDASPDHDRAWQVELRGRIGPFARSKRLRMVRVDTDSPDHLRFERRELDGIEHGSWILDVRVEPSGGETSRVRVVFEYRGRLWSGAMERLLRDEIESSKRRLTDLVTRGPQSADQAL